MCLPGHGTLTPLESVLRASWTVLDRAPPARRLASESQRSPSGGVRAAFSCRAWTEVCREHLDAGASKHTRAGGIGARLSLEERNRSHACRSDTGTACSPCGLTLLFIAWSCRGPSRGSHIPLPQGTQGSALRVKEEAIQARTGCSAQGHRSGKPPRRHPQISASGPPLHLSELAPLPIPAAPEPAASTRCPAMVQTLPLRVKFVSGSTVLRGWCTRRRRVCYPLTMPKYYPSY